MYGHPSGCSDEFLYKEPFEFTPHVLWLLSDSEDRKACPCKPCHRATGRKIPRSLVERLQADIAAKQAAAEKPVKKAALPKPSAATKKKAIAAAIEAGGKAPTKDSAVSKTKKTPTAKITSTPVSQQASPVPAPAPAPAPATNTALSSMPTPTSALQATAAAAAQYRMFNNEPTLFRRGEMVWYQQDPAWRIGIIRQVGAAPTHAYTIIPLGHSLLKMPDLVKQQGQMRPFLTFSVPGVGIEAIQNKIFSEVQWQELVNIYVGRTEILGLEASKMAAVEIDSSWSVFNQLPAEPGQPRNQSRYDGVFLGAEMIRRGDPIRCKDKTKGVLLEVAEIIVTSVTSVPTPGAPANMPSTTQDTLTFRGVEYEASLVPEQTFAPKQPQGAIFAKDTAFRSAAAKAGGANQKCIWTVRRTHAPPSNSITSISQVILMNVCRRIILTIILTITAVAAAPRLFVQTPLRRKTMLMTRGAKQIKTWDATWQERDVAGRSYVTDELINVTTGAVAVQQALQTGKFTEAQQFLNNRMQNAAAHSMSRRPNRRLTIGHAVSQAQPLKLGEGIMED